MSTTKETSAPVSDATKAKRKKKSAPLTPVERMEDMALTSRVMEALSPHLQGLSDATLTEFIIHLAEVQLKKSSSEDIIGQTQGFRTRLLEQGAPELPLSLCKRLLEWVDQQSPRRKRWKLRQEQQKQQKEQAGTTSNHDATRSSQNPLSKSFPGLAKPNLSHSVALESDFQEQQAQDSGKRKLSNLPAWMATTTSTTTSTNDDSKRSKPTLEPYQIVQGRIEKILDFGIVVSLLNTSREGVAYKSQWPAHITDPKQHFRKQQRVWVKILSVQPHKIVVSLKDVDPETGTDLLPHRTQAAAQVGSGTGGYSTAMIPPPSSGNATTRSRAPAPTPTPPNKDKDVASSYHRPTKQALTEHELYEAQQLIRSGVLPVDQYPTYDPKLGLLAVEDTEEETEVELAQVEPAFLKGQTKKSMHRSSAAAMEPIAIVKNPDGSLQRAALQQANMAKERRELRQAQANQLIDSIPKDLNRPWEDPMPEAGERHFAQELRSINVMSTAMDGAPEWKQKAENKTLSYGIISNKSIKEQRESLPIYRLKKELTQAMATNQMLVVIGETGSGKVSLCVCVCVCFTTLEPRSNVP